MNSLNSPSKLLISPAGRYLRTVVHKAGAPTLDNTQRCVVCEEMIYVPIAHHEFKFWIPGDYVAVNSSPNSLTAHRIGKNNQDPRCDGKPAAEFSQESLPQEVTA